METNRRFIVADHEVSKTFDTHTVIMMGDIGYWSDNYEELKRWCEQNNSEVVGMTIQIPDAQTLTAFCLRWL